MRICPYGSFVHSLSFYCSGLFYFKCNFRGRCETLHVWRVIAGSSPSRWTKPSRKTTFLVWEMTWSTVVILFRQFHNKALINELITATAVKTNVHITYDILIWKSLDACSSASAQTSTWGIVGIFFTFLITQSYSFRDTFTNLMTQKIH